MKSLALRSTIAIMAACSLLAGCQSSQKEEAYSRPMDEFGRGELTAAYVNYGNTNAGYDFMLTEVCSTYRNLTINPQAYATKNEFITDVTTQLNAGNGPDLFLLDFATPLSFQKMARNGTYADLTPYLEADSRYDADAYQGIEACQVNGGQYALPLSISSFALYTISENGLSSRISPKDYQSVDGMLHVLETVVTRFDHNLFYPGIFPWVYRTDFASMWLDAFNIPVVDFDSKEVVLDKELYYRIADIVRQKLGSLEGYLGREMEVIHDSQILKETGVVLTDMDRSLIRFYYYYTGVKELDLTPMHHSFVSYKDKSRTTAQIEYYAAVNQNSKNKLLAYETARIIMDYPFDVSVVSHIFPSACPANKATYQRYALSIGSRSGSFSLDDVFIDVKEAAGTRDELINSNPDLFLSDSTALALVQETMDDYIRGNTDDFEACWENLMNRLTLYLTE